MVSNSEPPMFIPVEEALPHVITKKRADVGLLMLEDAGLVVRARNRQGPKLLNMAKTRNSPEWRELYNRIMLAREGGKQ